MGDLNDKKLSIDLLQFFFSIQVLSTAQGTVQHSLAMTSAKSQFICGREEVCPTLEMYLSSFRKLHLIHIHVKQIHSSLSEFLMNKLLFTIYSNPFSNQASSAVQQPDQLSQIMCGRDEVCPTFELVFLARFIKRQNLHLTIINIHVHQPYIN